MYRDEYDLPGPARYPREYYERERYEERLPPPRGSYPLLDDPPYYRMRDETPRSKETRFLGTEYEGGLVQGSVLLVPPQFYPAKGPSREKPQKCNTVFVGSIPEGTTEKHLYDAFCECGNIQDVRVARSRGFGHVEFKTDAAVDKAILLNGYTLRIGPSSKEASKIQVDYAQSREASDAKRRMKAGEMLVFNAPNAHIISSDLRNEESFEFAAKNLISWIEKGSCSSTTANTFFGLLSSINTHCHKISKEAKSKEEECLSLITKAKEEIEKLLKDCDVIDSVFESAAQKKAWDQFTKPQRKTITQWKESAVELRKELTEKIDSTPDSLQGSSMKSSEEPPTKKMKADIDNEMAARLSRNVREMEQLKVDHEIALEKKEKQILQLKSLLARFKQSWQTQEDFVLKASSEAIVYMDNRTPAIGDRFEVEIDENCPDEWEKVIGGGEKNKDSTQVLSLKEEKTDSPPKVSKEESSQDTDEMQDGMEGEGEWEVIDGVNMDDLNKALDSGNLAGGGSLAQAAAAYAQLRTQLGSAKEESGMSLSENDIALAAVMAAFLTVHPLGATLTEIQSYFTTLNSSYNCYYLESVLRRLPKVFQYSQASAGSEYRWWFLGFQTVSVSSCNQHAATTCDVDNTQPQTETEMSEA